MRLEKKTWRAVGERWPILARIPTFSGYVVSRYRRGADGYTPSEYTGTGEVAKGVRPPDRPNVGCNTRARSGSSSTATRGAVTTVPLVEPAEGHPLREVGGFIVSTGQDIPHLDEAMFHTVCEFGKKRKMEGHVTEVPCWRKSLSTGKIFGEWISGYRCRFRGFEKQFPLQITIPECWRINFRYSCRKGLCISRAMTLEKVKREHGQEEEEKKSETKRGRRKRRRRESRCQGATKRILLRDENGRGWLGPAVARLAPQRGIGAATRGGIRARTISESKDVFLFLCASVFVCVWGVVVEAVSLWWTARSVNTSKLESVLVQLCFCFTPFGMRSQSRVPLECGAQWVDNLTQRSTDFRGSQQVLWRKMQVTLKRVPSALLVVDASRVRVFVCVVVSVFKIGWVCGCVFKVPEIFDERNELGQSCLASGLCFHAGVPWWAQPEQKISCGNKMEKLARFSVSVLKQTAKAWPLRVHTLRCLSSLCLSLSLDPTSYAHVRINDIHDFLCLCDFQIFEGEGEGDFCDYHFWDFGMFWFLDVWIFWILVLFCFSISCFLRKYSQLHLNVSHTTTTTNTTITLRHNRRVILQSTMAARGTCKQLSGSSHSSVVHKSSIDSHTDRAPIVQFSHQ